MKPKLYLDTSIPSAYYDNSKPIRQLITQRWFENKSIEFILYTSVVTIEEVDKFENIRKREFIKNLIFDYDIEILDLKQSAINLANKYIKQGAIPKEELADAYHIAIATVNKIEALASWNFAHIVSLNPIRKIHEINKKNKYPIIEIGSLLLFGGEEYGNL